MSDNLWKDLLRTECTYGAMQDCVRHNHSKVLEKIFNDMHSRGECLDDNSYQRLMHTAATHGSLECLILLQAYVAEPAVYSDVLNTAAEQNHLPIVQHIAPLVDEYSREDALALAALYNRGDVVGYLLTVCNPQNQSSKCLAAAAGEGHSELFELLYPLCSPTDALHYLKRKFENQPHTWEMLEHRILRDKLVAVTPHNRSNKRSKI